MATRNIVPRANLEGSLGTTSKKWQEANIQNVYAQNLWSPDSGSVSYIDYLNQLLKFTNCGIFSKNSPQTVSSSSTETYLMQALFPMPNTCPGLFSDTFFRIGASGVAGTYSTAPTMTWRVRIGPNTTGGQIVCSIAPTPATSQSNKPWKVDIIVNFRSLGVSGTVIGNGFCQNELSTTAPNYNKGSAITSPLTVDTTVNNYISLTFQFGTSSSSNTLTIHNGFITIGNVPVFT
jgi:hypothetical protein